MILGTLRVAAVCFGLGMVPWALVAQGSASPPPPADTLHGIIVPDPYRWMEDIRSPEVLAWASAQDSLTRSVLRRAPEYDAIHRRVAELAHIDDFAVPVPAGEMLYFLHVDGLDGRRTIRRVNHAGLDGGQILPEPDSALDVTNFAASPDERFLLRELGSEGANARQLLQVWSLDGRPTLVATREGAMITRRPWLDNGSSFVFSSPRIEGEPAIVYRALERDGWHGEPWIVVPAEGVSNLRSVVSNDGGWVLITGRVAGRTRVWARRVEGVAPLREISSDGNTAEYVGSLGSRLVFRIEDGSGRIDVTEASANGFGKWEGLVPPAEGLTLRQAYLFGSRILAYYLDGPRPLVRIFSLSGSLEHEVELPLGLIWTDYLRGWTGFSGDASHRWAYLRSINLTAPGIYRIDLFTGRLEPFMLRQVGIDGKEYAHEVTSYESHDGVRIPIFLAWRRDRAREQPRPTLIYAYGAYGFTPIPFFNAKYLTFMERGGLLAIPYLRGGGVFGDDWHRAGSGSGKTNTVQDLIHAGRWLVTNNRTRPGLLSIEGQSPGGTVAAAAALLAPGLWGAVTLETPLTDLVRDQAETRGLVSEFGSVEEPAVLRAMLATYSPYHLVQEGGKYPAVFVRTADYDRFVDPMHSYKLTRILQDRTRGTTHLRVAWSEGHGFLRAVDRRAAEWADDLVFISLFAGGG